MLKLAKEYAHAAECVVSAASMLNEAAHTCPFTEVTQPMKAKLREIADTLNSIAINIGGATVIPFPSQEEKVVTNT